MLHRNLDRRRVARGRVASRNLNPSNTDDVVGEYAQADAGPGAGGGRGGQGGLPGWRAATPQQRADALDRIGTEILARKDELGRLLSREEGKTLPEGVGEVAPRRADLQVLRRAGAGARGRAACRRSGPGSRSRSPASRWAWSG